MLQDSCLTRRARRGARGDRGLPAKERKTTGGCVVKRREYVVTYSVGVRKKNTKTIFLVMYPNFRFVPKDHSDYTMLLPLLISFAVSSCMGSLPLDGNIAKAFTSPSFRL